MHNRADAVLISLHSYSRILIHLYRTQTTALPPPLPLESPSLHRGAPWQQISEFLLCPAPHIHWELGCRHRSHLAVLSPAEKNRHDSLCSYARTCAVIDWHCRALESGRNLSYCQRGSSVTWFCHLSCTGISNHAGFQQVGTEMNFSNCKPILF